MCYTVARQLAFGHDPHASPIAAFNYMTIAMWASALWLLDFISACHSSILPSKPRFTHTDIAREKLMMVINGYGHYHHDAEQKQGARLQLSFIRRMMLQTETRQTCQTCCCFDMSQTGALCSQFPANTPLLESCKYVAA